jgi:hypothetical protein
MAQRFGITPFEAMPLLFTQQTISLNQASGRQMSGVPEGF